MLPKSQLFNSLCLFFVPYASRGHSQSHLVSLIGLIINAGAGSCLEPKRKLSLIFNAPRATLGVLLICLLADKIIFVRWKIKLVYWKIKYKTGFISGDKLASCHYYTYLHLTKLSIPQFADKKLSLEPNMSKSGWAPIKLYSFFSIYSPSSTGTHPLLDKERSIKKR